MPMLDGIIICEDNRFTEFSLPEDPDLKTQYTWAAWLNLTGIPAVLALTGRGYAVYREGLLPIQDE